MKNALKLGGQGAPPKKRGAPRPFLLGNAKEIELSETPSRNSPGASKGGGPPDADWSESEAMRLSVLARSKNSPGLGNDAKAVSSAQKRGLKAIKGGPGTSKESPGGSAFARKPPKSSKTDPESLEIYSCFDKF